jgi:hypothetical protein
MWGEPICDGVGVTIHVTVSYTGVRVCCLDVPLGTDDPRANNFCRSVSTLWELWMDGATATQSNLRRAVTIVWMRTSSTKTVVHALCLHSCLSLRPSRHCHLNWDVLRVHGATRVTTLASASTVPGDDGLITAMEAPPLC